jgi:hypothetical protein
MNSTSMTIPKALLDVWEVKRIVQEDIKDMTLEKRKAYFKKCSENFAGAIGKRWAKNEDGSYSLR